MRSSDRVGTLSVSDWGNLARRTRPAGAWVRRGPVEEGARGRAHKVGPVHLIHRARAAGRVPPDPGDGAGACPGRHGAAVVQLLQRDRWPDLLSTWVSR